MTNRSRPPIALAFLGATLCVPGALAQTVADAAASVAAPSAPTATAEAPVAAPSTPPAPAEADAVAAEPAPAPAPEAPVVEPAPPPAPPATEDGASEEKEAVGLTCLESKDGCKVDDLKTPTSPAFALIGIAPSDVETPRPPKDLALALYNAYNGGAIAQDLALEAAPYWLFAQPQLTYDEYVNAPLGLQLVQNATLSVATVANPDAEATDMAFGVRTSLFFVDVGDQDAAKRVKAAEEKLLKLQEAVADHALMEALAGC